MLSRRLFLAGSAAGGLGPWSGGAARAEAVMTDDGFYREPWFLESFLELADDLAAATENKKRLAIMWELRGCPYCKETHLVNFAKPEIASYHPGALRDPAAQHHRLARGDGFRRRKADREERSRRNTACAACRSSSSFPTAPRGSRKKPPREREVARGQGYIEPQPFLDMFRFVADRAYEKGAVLRLPRERQAQPTLR